MNLSSLPDDAIVTEMERRLNLGTVGFHGLYSSNQMDYREAWRDVMDWVNDMCNADFDYWNPVRATMLAAFDRHDGDRIESRRQVFAVNTTYYGEDAEKDHQPI